MVLVIIVSIIIKKKTKISIGSISGLGEIILGIVIYIGVLYLISITFPNFWNAWCTPMSFFVVTNIVLVLCVIAIRYYTDWAWIVIGIIAMFIIVHNYKQENKNEVSKKVELKKPILRFKGYTPCSPNMDFKYSLKLYSDETMTHIAPCGILQKFPGIKDEIFYDGESGIKAPPKRDFGEVKIRSSDQTKRVFVVIYQTF